MSEVKPSFVEEVQYRRYSDTSTQGQQIVFSVADRESLAPFIGREGKRAMLVLVWLNDDESPEQPVEPPKPKRTDTRGPFCREACELCESKLFRMWINVEDEEAAKKWLLERCGGIASRKEIDADEMVRELFIERVRVPFIRWTRTRGAPT